MVVKNIEHKAPVFQAFFSSLLFQEITKNKVASKKMFNNFSASFAMLVMCISSGYNPFANCKG